MDDVELQFSLDSKKVTEEEIRLPIIFPVSVVAITINFSTEIQNTQEILQEISRNIIEKCSFRKNFEKAAKEGFLELTQTGNIITCFYAKETPTKILFEANDLHIHSARYSLLNPSYTVRLKVIIGSRNARLITFGGADPLIAKAIQRMESCITGALTCGHSIVSVNFGKKEMSEILKRFDTNVEYIWVDPGESRRFAKFFEKKEGNKTTIITEYYVHAKLRGVRITGSPIVLSLIEEAGVLLREIEGKLTIKGSRGITSRISSDGKTLFYIPEIIIPPGSSAYEIAESMYETVIAPITNTVGTRQTTIGDYPF